MFSVLERLMQERNMKIADVARAANVAASTITDWRAGRYTPKRDKLDRIAEVFGVSTEFLMTGKDTEKVSESGTSYYFDDETAAVAQELFENRDLRVLFDAARDARPEDLRIAADLLKRFKETNPDG